MKSSIKRIPLTAGLLLIALIAFAGSLDIPNILVDHTTGQDASSASGAVMFVLGIVFVLYMLGVVLAMGFIWRGIAEWPLNKN